VPSFCNCVTIPSPFPSRRVPWKLTKGRWTGVRHLPFQCFEISSIPEANQKVEVGFRTFPEGCQHGFPNWPEATGANGLAFARVFKYISLCGLLGVSLKRQPCFSVFLVQMCHFHLILLRMLEPTSRSKSEGYSEL
jgi:hypothetical protein